MLIETVLFVCIFIPSDHVASVIWIIYLKTELNSDVRMFELFRYCTKYSARCWKHTNKMMANLAAISMWINAYHQQK